MPVEPRSFDRSFDRRFVKADVPRIARHSTRKTCGSLLAALDVHPRVAMQILRHSRVAITMEVYTEVPSAAAALLVGQCPREPEWAYHRVIKPRDPGYPITAGSDDEQSEGVPELAAWVAQVDRERRLAVRSGRHEPVTTTIAERDRGEELTDQLGSLVFQRHWRHAQPRVIGHEGDKPLYVGGFERGDELAEQLLLRGREGNSWPADDRRDRPADRSRVGTGTRGRGAARLRP